MHIWQRLVELEKAGADFGLVWPNYETIIRQIESECQEVRECFQQKTHINVLKEEVGDLLHAVTSLAWYCGLNVQEVLSASGDKFESRLQMMKSIALEQGLLDVRHLSFEAIMQIWDEAKCRLAGKT